MTGSPAMIVLFTDFGLEGPYVGQMKAVLHREAPGAPLVDLFHDAPAHDARAAAYLLAAYSDAFAEGCVFLCVVDPEVGSEARRPAVVHAAGRWFVGPDNGLFDIVARRADGARSWDIAVDISADIAARPERLSASFHGRDLFAPAAARIARGEVPAGGGCPFGAAAGWPDDLPEIVYIDRFGNALTGLRAAILPAGSRLAVGGRTLERARTFSDVAPGAAFWYENANGLAEIAVNRGRADDRLGLAVGAPVVVAE